MIENSAISPNCQSARRQLRPGFILLLCAHVVASCVSLSYAMDSFPGVVTFNKSHLFLASLSASSFAWLLVLFAASEFSFGYFIGFYFYTMILGYLWSVNFSLLSYNHALAIVSIFLSALAFLVPSLYVTSPVRRRFELSLRSLDLVSSFILLLTAGIIAVGALYNFKPVSFSEMYKFREQIEFPALLRYAIGITSSALTPFAFAWFVVRKNYWRAGAALLLLTLLYPVTLTKLALFAPLWLLFLTVLSRYVAAKTAVVLSLFLPMLAGLAVLQLTKAGLFPLGPGMIYFGTVNSRMIAMPSIALEVYNNFFAGHDLTHFCQINLLKLVLACPYDEQLSVVMSKAYQMGAFNASLFATEGIASVGLMFAPLSAFVCGAVIAFGNRLSSGLPPKFVLLSGGILPQIFLNVPLSTSLLTHGAVILFLLWYITPPALFEVNNYGRDSSEV